jgi:hypothetical protein
MAAHGIDVSLHAVGAVLPWIQQALCMNSCNVTLIETRILRGMVSVGVHLPQVHDHTGHHVVRCPSVHASALV